METTKFFQMHSFRSLIDEIKNFDRKVVWVIVISAISLAGINYFAAASRFSNYASFFATVGLMDSFDWVYQLLYRAEHSRLWGLLYWASLTVFFYFILPAFIIKVVFKERLRDYGLKRKEVLSYFSIYALLFACIFPVVLLVSFSKQFQTAYPFYSPKDTSDLFPYFVVWEIFYVLQFFALEFFFRGFMVHGLKQKMGIYSVAAMVVPYCMIHFTKPLPECIGSIFAGLILGILSFRTGSVWLGALIHIAVALSMDWLSLWQRGFLF